MVENTGTATFIMGSSTFGYNTVEDRIWLSNSAWHDRLWLTRRHAKELLRLIAQVLQGTYTGAEEIPAEDIEREHDDAINRPSNVAGATLQMGRETATEQSSIHFALCTRIAIIKTADKFELVLNASESEYKMLFLREELHRFLRALYLILKQTDWQLPQPPQWLTRSYLPAALQEILQAPLPENLDDDVDDFEADTGTPSSDS